MDWLWKIVLVCIILGAAQWLNTHPDSEMAQQILVFFQRVREEWNIFLTHASEYFAKFPEYIRQMLDTTPKPVKPA